MFLRIIVAAVLLMAVTSNLLAQEGLEIPKELAQATPLEVQIITSTAPPVDLVTPTATFTPSPDVRSAALLQAKASAGEVNVRADADIEGELLGQIQFGDQYVVTGRSYQWYRFIYESAPQGFAWVFDELVDVTGDPALIPDLSQELIPTLNATLIFATENAASMLQTPGRALTVAAGSREIVGPVAAVNPGSTAQNQSTAETEQAILPTFTYASQIAMIATESMSEVDAAEPTAPPSGSGTFPPILPIVVLGGFGMLGLAVSAMRR